MVGCFSGYQVCLHRSHSKLHWLKALWYLYRLRTDAQRSDSPILDHTTHHTHYKIANPILAGPNQSIVRKRGLVHLSIRADLYTQLSL